MTEKQRKIFSAVLDLNWELTQGTDFSKKTDLCKQLREKKEELKQDMGEAEYNKFMNMGTRMFAPKQ